MIERQIFDGYGMILDLKEASPVLRARFGGTSKEAIDNHPKCPEDFWILLAVDMVLFGKAYSSIPSNQTREDFEEEIDKALNTFFKGTEVDVRPGWKEILFEDGEAIEV